MVVLHRLFNLLILFSIENTFLISAQLLMKHLPLEEVLDRGGPLILVQLVELLHDDLSLLIPHQLAGSILHELIVRFSIKD